MYFSPLISLLYMLCVTSTASYHRYQKWSQIWHFWWSRLCVQVSPGSAVLLIRAQLLQPWCSNNVIAIINNDQLAFHFYRVHYKEGGNKENKYVFLIQLVTLDSYVRIDEKFQLFLIDYNDFFVCEFRPLFSSLSRKKNIWSSPK